MMPRAAAAILVSLALIDGAHSAVRLCKDAVSSDPMAAARETDARRAALADWTSRVRQTFGEAYTAWRLAAPKGIKCIKDARGFTCLALGQPCTVSQTAPRPPATHGKRGQDI